MMATGQAAPQLLPVQGHRASMALSVHAAMLAQPRSVSAAQGLVITLARQFNLSQVWLATSAGAGLPLRLLALSDGPLPAAGSALETALLGTCNECVDQAAPVVWPEPPPAPGYVPRITRAHAALATQVGSGASVAGVPLVADADVMGALGALRANGAAIDAATLEQLEHLACLAAPLLALMAANERSLWRRTQDSLRLWWASAGARRQRSLRQAGAALAVLTLVALLMPWPAQVSGRARLEGAVQRVVSAPMDGFVHQAHARAGDTVRAGQPLLDLADQDLQLERQRWQSQLAQHLDGLSAAQARADRSQLVMLQSRADEAQAQLDLVDERLQRAHLVAPFDAVVVQGDWSQQLGAPVKEGAELLTLAPSGRYRVIVEVDERDIPRLESADARRLNGSLTLSALPWNSLPLQVTRISPVAKAVEGRNVFEVEAALLEQSAGLRPGLQGQARIESQPTSPLLHVLRRGLGSVRLAWWEWFG